MVAHLDDAPFLQSDDLVGVADGAQAVGDDQRRAAPQHRFQRLLDQVLRLGVHRRGGLVQDEDTGVGQDGPRQRQPLFLAPAQLDAPLADLGVVAFGQRLDELVGVGRLGGGDKLLVAGVRLAVEQVLAHGAVEQEGVLQHHGHVAAQRVQRDLPQIMAVQSDPPLNGIVETAEQIGDAGLARAAGADQRHHLAGLHLEGDVA